MALLGGQLIQINPRLTWEARGDLGALRTRTTFGGVSPKARSRSVRGAANLLLKPV
jgi:hypothetical protein